MTRTPVVTLHLSNGDPVELHEGAPIEWDRLAGIGIPGTGKVVAMSLRDGQLDLVELYLDPNERLRAVHAEMTSRRGAWPDAGAPLFGGPNVAGPPRPTGLEGNGGPLVMQGYAIEQEVGCGAIRVQFTCAMCREEIRWLGGGNDLVTLTLQFRERAEKHHVHERCLPMFTASLSVRFDRAEEERPV